MHMKDYIHRFPRILVIEITKPLYTYEDADCVRIAEKYVKEASQNCQFLVVRTPKGEKTFHPKELKKVGKKVEEVFKYPDNPMVLFEINVPHCEKKDMDAYRWG